MNAQPAHTPRRLPGRAGIAAIAPMALLCVVACTNPDAADDSGMASLRGFGEAVDTPEIGLSPTSPTQSCVCSARLHDVRTIGARSGSAWLRTYALTRNQYTD